ncbi:MAG: hypothetical protein QF749_03980 [Verrucomicrobiota bacterium]|jgi:prepilin-type processing-associated H-X9-DG protein|nr:hypothetical protein [Verrucomicrobiota bacterium]
MASPVELSVRLAHLKNKMTKKCKQHGFTLIDFPASFHNGACGFAFGDGHAEIKKWLDKRTIVPAKNSGGFPGGLNQAHPNSPDVAWMQDRASARK